MKQRTNETVNIMNFKNWLNTFIDEKGIDRETIIEAEGASGTNFIPVGCLLEAIEAAPANEQQGIKATLVKIDFMNGNVMHFLKHLAKAIAI